MEKKIRFLTTACGAPGESQQTVLLPTSQPVETPPSSFRAERSGVEEPQISPYSPVTLLTAKRKLEVRRQARNDRGLFQQRANNTGLSQEVSSKRLWHPGQRPVSRMSSVCRRRRVWGNVTPEVFFCARLFAAQKAESHRDQGHVMMPPQPVAAFVMIEPELFLELAVIELHPPAGARGADEPGQTDGARAQLREPVITRCSGPLGPFEQEPLGDALQRLGTFSSRAPPRPSLWQSASVAAPCGRGAR